MYATAPESPANTGQVQRSDTGSAAEHPFGFQFDYTPPKGGYAWWYVDGVSADGAHAIVIIIFVGSVFSPYYAWSKTQDPANHCAINLALYGQPQRWSMTERGQADTERTRTTYQTGNSAVRFTRDGLEIDFNEISTPWLQRVRGTVRVTLPYLNAQAFQLDPNARHFWSPACSHAHISVDFDNPDLSWQGSSYVDSNYGLEPVTEGFDFWDWSRSPLQNGDTLIRYVTDPVGAAQRDLHVRISPEGVVDPAASTQLADLPPTRIWRIPRRTGAIDGAEPKIARTLEDTPFYSRSILTYSDAASGHATHETLSCHRLRSPIVKALLPFRMPRLSG